MKALSLWQPWASAIARGSKRIETRHWSTNYRGPLAIHAAARIISKSEYAWFLEQDFWRAAMDWADGYVWSPLPLGAIVAVCVLADCVPTETIPFEDLELVLSSPTGGPVDPYAPVWSERMMGDFTPGRFAWVLHDIRPLPKPIPFRGRQQLFEVPDDLIRS